MSIKIDFKRVEKFQKDLEQKSKDVSGQYSFKEIFPDNYIQSISRFASLDELLSANPEPITDAESFKQASQEVLDNFISQETPFSNWQNMLNDAGAKLIARKLNL